MGKRFAHMVVAMSGRNITTRCGRHMKLGTREQFWERFTVWASRMTCPRCIKFYDDYHATPESRMGVGRATEG